MELKTLNILRALYKFGRNITLKEVQLLLNVMQRKTYPAGAYLIQAGSLKKEVFYIQKGLIRIFAINEKGEEITINIKKEHQFVASPYSHLFDQPAKFYVQALEETTVFTCKKDTLESIIRKHPQLEQNRKYVLQSILKESLQRVESFVLYSPEERYLNYLEAHPNIINRVPNKYIAHILGITPVSLSRIRKRIASKSKRKKT